MKNVIWDDCPGLEISTLKVKRKELNDIKLLIEHDAILIKIERKHLVDTPWTAQQERKGQKWTEYKVKLEKMVESSKCTETTCPRKFCNSYSKQD